MRRDDRVTYRTTSFFSLLKMAGISSFIFNASFLIALIFSILSYLFFKNDVDYSKQIDYFSDTIASISATLLGLVIAGLAILIALVQGKITGMLLQKQVLQRFLFPFWLLSVTWALSTGLSISMYIFYEIINKYIVYALCLEVFIFVYSLCGTISLMGHAIKIGIFMADFSSNNDTEE